METEDQLCKRYEIELAAFAALDRRYYLSSCPTLADRTAYATRQEQLEQKRYQFYAELKEIRELMRLRRCRSVVRQSALHPHR